MSTLMFVGAHPDDETFGLGGTLAHYARRGARTVYVCATRGEVGSAEPHFMRGHATPGDMRWAELKAAAEILRLEILHLGYRDSGMPGSPDNAHPQALVAAPLAEVTGRVVAALRAHRPEVVITFDPIGGYRHPDHIAIHQATVAAFHAAGDPARYPEAGPAFAPRKLYFQVFPRGLLKAAVRLMPLFGQNPRQFGRNKDIDLLSLTEVDFPVHASIHLGQAELDMKDRATACHASQLGGGPDGGGWARRVVRRVIPQREDFMRAYPPVTGSLHETDLLAAS